MKVELKKGHLSDFKGGLLCVFLMQNDDPPWDVKPFLKDVPEERFEGKLLQTYSTDTMGQAKFAKLLVVGLGKKEEYKIDFLRRVAGTAVRYAAGIKEKELTIYVPSKFVGKPELNKMAQAVVEGAILAQYKFTQYKTKKDDLFVVEKLHILSKEEIGEGVKRGIIYAEAQNYARELDEQPANVASPKWVVEEARKLAKKYGLHITVYDKNEMKKKGMNAILAVAQGSAQDPHLVRVEYNKGKHPTYCVIGKGVVFDSGGINIKPSPGMHEMKYDKTGAMNVLGVMKAVAELKLPIHVVGFMPMVENMPSGSAQRPGDIVKAYNGKTIEVLNTDAEGRLILADTLTFATEEKPAYMIDMATLTGAMVVALGRHAIGVFSNDDTLAKTIEDAGTDAHERVWRMPVWPEYTEMMKSDFADIKNISDTGEAGSITAAAFLQEFVGETKWAHLDIAAVDMVKTPHPYLDKGATGIGVRLVTETLVKLAKKK
ncbi:cytosol aminopeptidase [Candidatus Bilamarchaeum dharawalense]|uniref:Probable cytosol aminopeptidase n=1 Tax=Candidatus Bilamarchaeum dharawalense TaxID=2885759 RepID=A0A5E4LRK9_9ARCH|nr:cytosol aminopeptidase [Candidatus Bilamarchaeum dharawalense]